MEQRAQIIVDVPTMQTNQPYTYLVPEKWQQSLLPGMRVIVPFGKGQRKVQGMVVGVLAPEETLELTTHTLKKVDSIMDLRPVLNQELLELAPWLADQTYAFLITCIQTMLPNMLKAKYHKSVRLLDELGPDHLLFKLFENRDEVALEEFSKEDQLAALLKLQRQQKVEMLYQVSDKVTHKTRRYLSSLLSFEQIEEARADLNRQAKKQNKLLSLLHQLGTNKIAVKEAAQNWQMGEAVFKTAEEKGWIEFEQVEINRDPYADHQFKKTDSLTLTIQQKAAYEAVLSACQKNEAQTFLLEGVTGSGKTEVYLQNIAACLEKGKTAIMLVPEIALTPQMVNRFKGRFGADVAVLHSGLSDGEKYDEWRKIEKQEARVVVGARSAIFAPLENIGLIIIDEEHETSYKQDEKPRYHTRDVAIWRSQYHHCPLVLGSATPSLESRARAQKGVYHHLRLTERINGQKMPEVEIVDMRVSMQQHRDENFSAELMTKIEERLAKKEQTVLLLNRRGFSSFVMCRDCGYVLTCPNCDISLTLHMDTHSMKCHYCGHEEAIPNRCPSCQSNKIRYYGTGTQKVEQALQEKLPEARILRMDVDTTRKKGAHERILKTFGAQEADILLGTQMIAKGLDFPNVTLVGVLNADTSLNLPDFRASERTFQLLTQVSGRAGRAEKAGEVVVQTFNPEHYAIRLAQKHDYERFFAYEMQVRHRGLYPPYFFTVQVTASHTIEEVAADKMFELAQEVRQALSSNALLLGPTPKSIARVNKRYYYQMVIKYKKEPHLKEVLNHILQESQKDYQKGLQITIDPEPLQFM